MRTVFWSCDKCGEPIHVGRVTIEVATGPERLRRPRLDLCGRCASEFWGWVDRPPPVAGPAPGREVPDGDGAERTAGEHRPTVADG